MTTRPPAEIGMSLDEVDTPALVIDLDAFERNLRRLPERIAGTAVRLRPHAKTHKCPVIALRQMALGRLAHIAVCVDDASQVEALEAAAGEAGVALPVYVEVNMGGNRSGVEPG